MALGTLAPRALADSEAGRDSYAKYYIDRESTALVRPASSLDGLRRARDVGLEKYADRETLEQKREARARSRPRHVRLQDAVLRPDGDRLPPPAHGGREYPRAPYLRRAKGERARGRW